MDISKLPSNSNASKGKAPETPTKAPTDKKVGKVVSGNVKVKKNEIRKFTDIFIAEDIDTVKDYVVNDLVVPTCKNLFVDLIQNSVEMLVLGGRRGGSGHRTTADRVSYRDYGSYSRDDRRVSTGRTRNNFDYEDFEFDYRRDAETVLDQMDDIIRRYGLVRVSDLYDMCDRTAPHTAHNYGWTSMNRAEVIKTRSGYALKLPRASAID